MLHRRRWLLGRPPLDVPFTLNRHSPLARGLIAWWPFIGSRGANVLVDFSGYGRHGAFAGAGSPAWVTDAARGAALSFDGSNDYVDIYSIGLRDAFNGAEGTVVAWAKVSGSGVWSDGALRKAVRLKVDANNNIQMNKHNTNGYVQMWYKAGGTTEQIWLPGYSSVDWMHWVITWSKSADEFKFFYNGMQNGSTQTGLGTWAGQLSSTDTVIGSDAIPAAFVWDGCIGEVRIYNRPLSAAEIRRDWDPATRWELYRPLRGMALPRPPIAGFALGYPHLEEAMCEADCEMDVQRVDIVRETRTAGGQLKRDVVASKRVFRFAYSWLPGQTAYTYDGGMGRDALWNLYTAGRELSFHLPLQGPFVEDVTVRFRAGSWREVLLLRDSAWGFVYVLGFELEEV